EWIDNLCLRCRLSVVALLEASDCRAGRRVPHHWVHRIVQVLDEVFPIRAVQEFIADFPDHFDFAGRRPIDHIVDGLRSSPEEIAQGWSDQRQACEDKTSMFANTRDEIDLKATIVNVEACIVVALQ